MKRKNLNSKGSALVFLLFAMSIISIIGSTALLLSLINYRMKNINSQVKKAFYLSEAGIDEAYIMSKHFIRESVDYAINRVKAYEEAEKQWNDARFRTLNHEQYTSEIANEVFQSAFKDYLNGTCNDMDSNKGLADLLNDYSSYLIYKNGYPRIAGSLIENPNDFFLEVKSIYVYQNVQKEINIELKINIPTYDTDMKNSDIDGLIHIIDWKLERKI